MPITNGTGRCRPQTGTEAGRPFRYVSRVSGGNAVRSAAYNVASRSPPSTGEVSRNGSVSDLTGRGHGSIGNEEATRDPAPDLLPIGVQIVSPGWRSRGSDRTGEPDSRPSRRTRTCEGGARPSSSCGLVGRA